MIMIKEIGPPMMGEMNVNVPVAIGGNAGGFLLRSPYENRRIARSLAFEYTYLGFMGKGLDGQFSRRSPKEQHAFTRFAYQHGLRVLPASGIQGEKALYPFLDGVEPLDVYLAQAPKEESERVTFDVISDIHKAHTLDIVYGDRWSKNILVSLTSGAVHIDFDLKLAGRYAKEFEIGQAAYYLVSGGKEKILSVLAAFFGAYSSSYDMRQVKQFMKRHVTYFQHTKYGGIQDEIETLWMMIEKNTEVSTTIRR